MMREGEELVKSHKIFTNYAQRENVTSGDEKKNTQSKKSTEKFA